jgi:hypothetical protein
VEAAADCKLPELPPPPAAGAPAAPLTAFLAGGLTAKELVLWLSLDDGVAARAHRVRLFDPALTHAGAAVGALGAEAGAACVVYAKAPRQEAKQQEAKQQDWAAAEAAGGAAGAAVGAAWAEPGGSPEAEGPRAGGGAEAEAGRPAAGTGAAAVRGRKSGWAANPDPSSLPKGGQGAFASASAQMHSAALTGGAHTSGAHTSGRWAVAAASDLWLQQLHALLHARGSMMRVRDLMRTFDLNHDGTVSMQEFRLAMQQVT